MTCRISLLPRWSAGLCLTAIAACGQTSAGDPINVAPQVFFNQSCPQAHAVYTVPAGKRLIVDDASATAVDAASASDPNDPGIVPNVPVHLSFRTNPTGTIPWGSADHTIVHQVGLPAGAGRLVTGYAEAGTDILFLIGGCTVPINVTFKFSGRLVDATG